METAPSYIASGAERSKQLLAQLSSLDHAPSALVQTNAFLSDVEKQLRAETKKLESSTRKTQKELNEHEKYRDSTVRKFAHRVTGQRDKFDAKALKEEKEYFEAVQELKECEDRKRMLESQLQEAKQTRAEYEAAEKKHTALQKELDELYNSLFQGPTPEFPEEDAQENVVKEASQALGQTQSRTNNERDALQYLQNADASLGRAERDIQDALAASRQDMIGFMSTFAAFEKRNALNAAQTNVSKAQWLVNQARGLIPAVQPLGNVELADQNLWADILFDNVFSDYALHEKIKSSAANLYDTRQRLRQQIPVAKQRLESAVAQQKEVDQMLQDARQELQEIRRLAIERAAQGSTEAPPPEYSAS